MRFYDNNGNIHNNRVTMVAADISSSLSHAKDQLGERFRNKFKSNTDEDTDEFIDEFEEDEFFTDDNSETIIPDDTSEEIIIENDIINNKVNIKTISGQPVASAEISGSLTEGRTEKILGEVLYPNGNAPAIDLENPTVEYRCKCGSMKSSRPTTDMCPFCGEDCNIPVKINDTAAG